MKLKIVDTLFTHVDAIDMYYSRIGNLVEKNIAQRLSASRYLKELANDSNAFPPHLPVDDARRNS